MLSVSNTFSQSEGKHGELSSQAVGSRGFSGLSTVCTTVYSRCPKNRQHYHGTVRWWQLNKRKVQDTVEITSCYTQQKEVINREKNPELIIRGKRRKDIYTNNNIKYFYFSIDTGLAISLGGQVPLNFTSKLTLVNYTLVVWGDTYKLPAELGEYVALLYCQCTWVSQKYNHR